MLTVCFYARARVCVLARVCVCEQSAYRLTPNIVDGFGSNFMRRYITSVRHIEHPNHRRGRDRCQLLWTILYTVYAYTTFAASCSSRLAAPPYPCLSPLQKSHTVSEMTYTVSSGTLNTTIPYHTIPLQNPTSIIANVYKLTRS